MTVAFEKTDSPAGEGMEPLDADAEAVVGDSAGKTAADSFLKGDSRLASAWFDEPRWPLRYALNWITFRRVELLSISEDDARSLRFQATYHDDGVVIIKNPAAALRPALVTGAIKAIGADNKDMPCEAWDVYGYDLREWPNVRFRRDDVLRLWPGRCDAEAGADTPMKILSLDEPSAEVETKESATPPTKAPGKKVSIRVGQIAEKLKTTYSEGRPVRTIAKVAEDLKTSESTIKRAYSVLEWSRPRRRPTAK